MTSKLTISPCWHDGRIEVVQVHGDVDGSAGLYPIQHTGFPPALLHLVGENRLHLSPVDLLPLLGTLAPDPDLDQLRPLPHPRPGTGMVVPQPLVALAQVGVSVEVDHRQVRPGLGAGPHRTGADGVLPAQGHHELPVPQESPDLPGKDLHQRGGILAGELHGRRAVDPVAPGLPAGLLVEEFHLLAGDEDGLRSLLGPPAVCEGPSVRHRKDHDPGALVVRFSGTQGEVGLRRPVVRRRGRLDGAGGPGGHSGGPQVR
jgi:hypothetical protein